MLDNNFRDLVAKRYGFRKTYPDLWNSGKDAMGQDEINGGRVGQAALKQGVELFNARDYFHAHEVWEDWWRVTTRPEKRTIQGMIQIAVAMHHASTGNFTGAASVMERALRNLEAADERWLGLDMTHLRADLGRTLQQLKANGPVTHFEISFA